MNRSPLVRVTADSPCPVCGKADWCSFSDRIAICMRVISDRPTANEGWIHRLDQTAPRPAVPVGPTPTKEHLVPATITDLLADARKFLNLVDLDKFATSLGVSGESLRSLGIGWFPQGRHTMSECRTWTQPGWTLPMRDATGTTVGIQVRNAFTGRKTSVRGSRLGLFLPQDLWSRTVPPGERLFVAEGCSDSAALLTLGYGYVVGRPSCQGGVGLLCELVRRLRCRHVVIVSDQDAEGQGQAGAKRLQAALLPYVTETRTILPPPGTKDVRAWLQAGCTRQDIENAINRAVPRRRFLIA